MSHRADLNPTPRDEPLPNSMKRRANIPELFWKTSLDKIPDRISHKQPILDYVAEMHESQKKGLGLILLGSFGTGKSVLACLLLIEAMLRGPARCYYVEASEIPSIAIEKPTTLSGESVWELLRGRAQFLVIDDLGDGKNTDWTASTVTRVINARRGAMRPTFITSNLPLEDKDGLGLLQLVPRLKQLGGDAYQVIETDSRLKWRTPF